MAVWLQLNTTDDDMQMHDRASGVFVGYELTLKPLPIIVLFQILEEQHGVRVDSFILIRDFSGWSSLGLFDHNLLAGSYRVISRRVSTCFSSKEGNRAPVQSLRLRQPS